MNTVYLEKLRTRQKTLQKEMNGLSTTIRATIWAMDRLKDEELDMIHRYRKLATDKKITATKEKKALEKIRAKNTKGVRMSQKYEYV